MGRVFGWGFWAVLSSLFTLGCNGEPAAENPRAKWLEECFTNEDCGSTGSCLCGRCTVSCADSCENGPAGSACTRTSGCGTVESGVCVSRCLRTLDCAEGLECKGGLCTAHSVDEADAGAPDAEALPGLLSTGTDGAWARTLRGYYRTPPGFWAHALYDTPPFMAPGPDGDLIVLLPSEVALQKGSDVMYVTDDWLARLDGETGRVEWFESVPSNAKMAVDPSGNVILAWPALLQKLDPDGNLVWLKERAPQVVYDLVAVAVDGDGNVIDARLSDTESPSTIGANPRGIIELEKLDPNGNEVFSRTIGPGQGLLDLPFVTTDASNDVVLLVGVVERGADFGGGVLDGYNVLAKYDPDGQHVFSKALGGYPEPYYINNPLHTTPQGNIVCLSGSIDPVDIGLGEISCAQYLFELDGAGAPVSSRCVLMDDLAPLPGGGISTVYRLFDPIPVGDDQCNPPDFVGGGGLLAHYDQDFNLVGHYCNSDMGAAAHGVLPAPAGHVFLSGSGSIAGQLPGGIELAEGGLLVAKVPVP